jgi:hypothetical protein
MVRTDTTDEWLLGGLGRSGLPLSIYYSPFTIYQKKEPRA